MSKHCQTCGRGALAAQKRSHANNTTKTRKELNLQTKRLAGKTYRLCTRCIRTVSKKPKFLEKAGKVVKRLSSRDKKASR